MVADDNEIIQVVSCKFLQKLGCQVEVARTGREAVEAITRTAYDIVLMDCEMPEMDGYEATREIPLREEGALSHLPIMALTGHASDEDAQKCRQAPNMYKVMAPQADYLEANWNKIKTVMKGSDKLNSLTKEIIAVAVSTVMGCKY